MSDNNSAMKILAIDHLLPGVTIEQVMVHMKAEVEQSQDLLRPAVD
jgi:hypothetical protein